MSLHPYPPGSPNTLTTTLKPTAVRSEPVLRGGLAVAVTFAVALAGCTGVGGKVGLNKASLDEPDFGLDPTTGDANTVFKVDSLGLGDKYNVTWDWGDGVLTYGDASEHKFGFSNGVMTVTMVATSSDGEQGIATKQVTLGSGQNKAPTVTARAQRTWIEVGKVINLTATGNDGDRDPMTYFWSYTSADSPAEKAIEGKTNRVPVSFDAPGKYVVKVRARDPKGGEGVGNVTIDVSKSIPSNRFDAVFNGTIKAGSGGQGVSEKAWLGSPTVPDTDVDSTRHFYHLDYPANTLLFLIWNDTSTQGVFDLDLELRKADGTVVFTSATRAPAAPFEFNVTAQDPGDYYVVVRGVVGADVKYQLLLQSTLQITPETVAAAEGG